jgi:hypothetical protein
MEDDGLATITVSLRFDRAINVFWYLIIRYLQN